MAAGPGAVEILESHVGDQDREHLRALGAQSLVVAVFVEANIGDHVFDVVAGRIVFVVAQPRSALDRAQNPAFGLGGQCRGGQAVPGELRVGEAFAGQEQAGVVHQPVVFGIAALEVGQGQKLAQKRPAFVAQRVCPTAVDQHRGQDLEGAAHQFPSRPLLAAPEGAVGSASDFFGIGVDGHRGVHAPQRVLLHSLAGGFEAGSGSGVDLGVVVGLFHFRTPRGLRPRVRV